MTTGNPTGERIDLCGVWRFLPDPVDEGEQAAFFSPAYDHRRWREAGVPSVFEACCPGLEAYEGTGWFRRVVTMPAAWRDRRVVLRFAGVNVHARVWVNGQEAGGHDDGFLPFELPVHDLLRFGEGAAAENLIAVRVDNVRREGEVPGMKRGWRTMGGILREVELAAGDPLHIAHTTITAEPAPGGGTLSLRVEVGNERAVGVEAALRLHVLDAEQKVLATFEAGPLALEAGREGTASLGGPVPGVEAWSPEAPHLYTARVQLELDGHPVDAAVVRFGFRKVEAREGRLWLNGEPVYLTGFNRHEDSPRTAMAVDLETARRDLVDMRAAGANFVRLCHYPHHPGELDLCDELGLLAMGEIPLYWWAGEKSAATLEAASRQLRAMIRRDSHHPALIFWSVSNETDEERDEVVAGNRSLVRLAQELDPTRPAVHVSNHWLDAAPEALRGRFAADDVVCVNAYPSLARRALGGQHDYDWAEGRRFWRAGLQALHEACPDKPILVTEFGYTSFVGVHDGAFGEEAQAQAIAAEFAGMQAPYVCGATIWCWADHPWPASTFGFCHYLDISPYGIVTRDRRRLAAYGTVRRMFRERQGIAAPEAAGPQSGPAGDPLFMIRPHLRDLPQIPFPEGFGIRPMRPGDAGLWADIERDAEAYFPIGDGLFEREFGHDPEAVGRRCFIVTNGRGVGVGTISAWYDRDYRGQEYGRVHYVAIRPAYQGRGLGKAALAFCLQQLARWHTRAYLDTQSMRLPAIKMYLDFGFEPVLDMPGAEASWRRVRAQLWHPTLERVLGEPG